MTTTDSALPTAPAPQSTAVPAVSLDQMQKALAAGEATPLSQTVTDIIRYQSTWFLYDRDGWVPVDGDQLTASLDAAARDMAIADRQVTTNNRL
jgi:hypothetical protein